MLLAVVFLAAGAAGIVLLRPYRGFTNDVFLNFPKGTDSKAMASELAAAGVIRNRWLFIGVRALWPKARLQAGEYRFWEPASAWTVFRRIEHGDVFYYEVTVPEGSNIFDVAQLVGNLGFIRGPDMLKVARDPAPIRDLAPDAPSLEGYLFPSTYRLTRSASAKQVCRMMTDVFRKQWQDLKKPAGLSGVNRVVTLASMIEKETAVPEERPKVASVYLNRLRIGMSLDCDPTTIYAAILRNRYRGVIHRSDLDSIDPYNTYRHPGLPPGPIANPGIASLKAALAPAETAYLYFVARPDGSGGHHFSSTLAEHTAHVREYRQEAK